MVTVYISRDGATVFSMTMSSLMLLLCIVWAFSRFIFLQLPIDVTGKLICYSFDSLEHVLETQLFTVTVVYM